QASVDGLGRWIQGTPNLSLIWGEARFTGPREIEVDGERIIAPKIFINTGGRPVVPAWPGLAEVPYLTNTSMMDVDFLPGRLIVVNVRAAFTHTSYNDHEILVANLLEGGARKVSDRIPAYALFTDPPLGRVGMTEAEVRASGRPALVGTLPMTRVGRARER